MTIETIPHSGALLISDIVDDRYFHRTYYGYTRREAIEEFRADVEEELSTNIVIVGEEEDDA
jgi:hypothetical protein